MLSILKMWDLNKFLLTKILLVQDFTILQVDKNKILIQINNFKRDLN